MTAYSVHIDKRQDTDRAPYITAHVLTQVVAVWFDDVRLLIPIEHVNDWIKGLTEAREKFGTEILAMLDAEEAERELGT